MSVFKAKCSIQNVEANNYFPPAIKFGKKAKHTNAQADQNQTNKWIILHSVCAKSFCLRCVVLFIFLLLAILWIPFFALATALVGWECDTRVKSTPKNNIIVEFAKSESISRRWFVGGARANGNSTARHCLKLKFHFTSSSWLKRNGHRRSVERKPERISKKKAQKLKKWKAAWQWISSVGSDKHITLLFTSPIIAFAECDCNEIFTWTSKATKWIVIMREKQIKIKITHGKMDERIGKRAFWTGQCNALAAHCTTFGSAERWDRA